MTTFVAPRPAAALLLCCALLSACGGEDAEAGPPGGRGGPAGAGSAIPVAAEIATPSDLRVTQRGTANLQARRQVDVLPKQGGLISRILVEEGDRVASGAALAILDSEEWRLQAGQAEARALAARKAAERADVLERDELIAAQEAERLRSESAVAAADVGLARLRVRNATIRSPIGGVVTHRMVEPGQLVTSATPTFGIAETSRLEAEIGIPEREAGRIRRGQQAILRVEGTTTTIQGEVSRVRPVVDAESGTVQVTVEVDPATTPQLRPGQFVNVEIVTDRLQDRITLPRTAVLVDGPQPRVFVLQGGVAEERTVTLGRSEGERVEIERGVAPGDTVVTVGQDGLRPQAPVRLIELNGEPVAQSAAPAAPRESAPPGERRQARRRRPDAGR